MLIKTRRPLASVCLFIVALICVLVLAGVIRSDAHLPGIPDGSRVRVCGTAAGIFDKYIVIEDARILELQAADSVTHELLTTDIYTFIADFGEETSSIRLGESVTFSGKYRQFSKAFNPGGFDAYEYYTSKGFDGCIVKCGVIRAGGRVSHIKEFLRRLRESLERRLYEVCPEKEASILCNILLGDKDSLDDETKNLYRDNGIAHILSISGLHISILGLGCYRLLRKLRIKNIPSALMSSAILILYGMMTGMSTSAVRAVGMFTISMLARPAKKTPDPLTNLSVMAAFVAITDPLSVKGVSFLLSYGAAFGIFVYLPAAEYLFTLGRSREAVYREGKVKQMLPKLLRWMSSSLRASFSITIFTLPVQLYFFYRVSVPAVLLNVMILPLMPVLIFAGMAAMIPGLGIAGKLCCILLGFFEILCKAAGAVPFHHFSPGRPGTVFIILYYVVIAAQVVISAHMKKHKKPSSAGKGYIFILLTFCLPLLLVFPLPKANTAAQLYIGQGNCGVMITDAKEVYMFDCGSTSLSLPGEYTLLPYLRINGIGRIDAVFLSHSDSDHINGCIELLEHSDEWDIHVGGIYISPQTAREDSENSLRLMQACVAAGVPAFTISAGDSWKSGSTEFTCLHPDISFTTGDPNSGSLCILASFENGGSVLYPGDVEGSGEEALIEAIERSADTKTHDDTPESLISIENTPVYPAADTKKPMNPSFHVDVYITAHHGSAGSSSDELLTLITPDDAINSAGLNNRYSHPSRAVLDRFAEHGCRSFTTYETGAVFMDFSGDEVSIDTYLPSGRKQRVVSMPRGKIPSRLMTAQPALC